MIKGVTTTEAARRLGISTARVRQLVLDGRLPAEKFGRDLVISEADLESFERLKGGRPPKANDQKKAGREALKRKALARWEGEGGKPASAKKSAKKKGRP